MSRSFFIIPIVLISVSCRNASTNIVNENDVVQYLDPTFLQKEKEKNRQEIGFWQQRLVKDTDSYVNKFELASNYLHRFKLTGIITELLTGDSLLKKSSEKLNNKEANILFSLSQNCITQHQFGLASLYNERALQANGDPYIVRLLQFDTRMELGQYAEAQKALNGLKDKTSFDYLIRIAKWEDHKGDLDKAILHMEEAFQLVKNKKKSLYCWTLSNLADMYGHAGRVNESYNAYLDVLSIDPTSLYCLKGIAWICFSNDGNTILAKKILQYILSQTRMPDLKLLLATISEFENNKVEQEQWLRSFTRDVQQPGYGGMYNKYLIDVYNSDPSQYTNAISLATAELKNRFTPEICDWLAWSYYKTGEKKKALEYTNAYVYRRTFEPDALMHTAFIYADNGRTAEAKELLKQCLESSFEIGPVAVSAIKEKLSTL